MDWSGDAFTAHCSATGGQLGLYFANGSGSYSPCLVYGYPDNVSRSIEPPFAWDPRLPALREPPPSFELARR
jgi:hypothetical protein